MSMCKVFLPKIQRQNWQSGLNNYALTRAAPTDTKISNDTDTQIFTYTDTTDADANDMGQIVTEQ